MRILYVHQYFVAPDESGGTRSFEMARRLVEAGHEVELITSDRSPCARFARWRTREVAGIRLHAVGVAYDNAMPRWRRLAAFGTFATLASARAARTDCDVVLATSTPLTVALPGLTASVRHAVPMVFEVRDLWPDVPIAVGALRTAPARRLARELERLAYAASTRIVALSPGMRDGVTRQGVPEDRLSVIPNACDRGRFGGRESEGADFRARHEWLRDRPLVVYAGTFGYANDVGWLARLARAVDAIDPQVRFLAIGDGGERHDVMREADRLGQLGRNLFVLPPVSKDDVPSVLAAADVCTSLFRDVPGLVDNSANKFFDALAAGRPVAINYGGWQAQLLRETGAGLVLDRDDLDAAATEITDVLHDAQWLHRAGCAAAALARERFDRDALATQLESVLMDATKTRDPIGRRRLSG